MSRKSLTKFLRNDAPFLAVAPGRGRAPCRPCGPGSRPGRGRRRSARGGSSRASCAATVSISTPPSVEAIRTGHLQVAVDGQAEVELAGDVVADGDQHLGDRLPLRAGLVGDEGLAQQAGGGLLGLGRGLDELNALGHAVGPGLLAAGDRQGLVAVDLGADGDPLASAAGVDLGLDDDQAAAERVVGLGGLVGRRDHDPLRDGDPGLLKQFLRLIFVDFHDITDLIRGRNDRATPAALAGARHMDLVLPRSAGRYQEAPSLLAGRPVGVPEFLHRPHQLSGRAAVELQGRGPSAGRPR